MGADYSDWYRRLRPPGLVGEYFYHRIRYVPRSSVASVVGIGGLAGGMGGVAVSKFGGWLFDFYNAQNAIHTGYAIMFAFCALAYVIAWV